MVVLACSGRSGFEKYGVDERSGENRYKEPQL